MNAHAPPFSTGMTPQSIMIVRLTLPCRKDIRFTPKDFDSIGIYLETSRIIYYGIDKENCKPKITALAYSPEKGCYKHRPETQGLPREVFQKEVEKEALFLEKKYQ